MGMLIVAPVILSWTGRTIPWRALRRWSVVEALLAFGLMIGLVHLAQ